MKFGWSERSIAMEGPVLITGQFYERISKGILDPNTLTAFVAEGEGGLSIMVSADLVSVSDGIIFEIREAVKKKEPAIPTDCILMSATHTHTSPRYMRQTGYDKAPCKGVEVIEPEAVRSFLVEQASDAIVEAYRNRKEGSYAYGYGYAVAAHHRRPTYFDDLGKRAAGQERVSALYSDKFARMYGKTNDDQFRGYEGVVDSNVNLFFTFDGEGKLVGAIVNVPCPSQNSEVISYLSADYWCETRKLIREKYGNIFLLAQCACAGDMSPRTLHYRQAEMRKYRLKFGEEAEREMCNRREIALRIAQCFDEVYGWAQKERFTEGKVLHCSEVLTLPAWKVSDAQYEESLKEYEKYMENFSFKDTGDALADFKENTMRSTTISRFEGVIARYRKKKESYEAECHFVRIGEVAFCSNPFELYISYQHRIQARSPFVQTFAVQLAAKVEAAGYLCTPQARDNMGYSAIMYSCDVSPEGGDVLVETTVSRLKELAEA